jgi:hypothetical protein
MARHAPIRSGHVFARLASRSTTRRHSAQEYAVFLGARQAQPDLDVCKSERDDAAEMPPAAEDMRALRQCTDRWRDMLSRANEELKQSPPDRRAGCEADFAAWQAASGSDPTSYEAMTGRLRARREVERCNAERLTAHPSAAVQPARPSGRALIIVGTVLTTLGGVGLTASGAVGLATMNRAPTNSIEGNSFAILAWRSAVCSLASPAGREPCCSLRRSRTPALKNATSQRKLRGVVADAISTMTAIATMPSHAAAMTARSAVVWPTISKSEASMRSMK